LLVVLQNRWEDEDDTGHTSRYSGLLRLEASPARVYQSSIKTGGAATRMVHVVSLRRLCEVEVEDGQIDTTDCIRFFYPIFIIFIVLASKDILVF
jgi:hypothetical protein